MPKAKTFLWNIGYILLTYVITLIQLIITGALASPVAKSIILAITVHDPSAIFIMMIPPFFLIASFMGPMIAFNYFCFLAAPFITILKLKKCMNIYIWVIGITVLSLLNPVLVKIIAKILFFMELEYLLDKNFSFLHDSYDHHTVYIFTLAAFLVSWMMFKLYEWYEREEVTEPSEPPEA